MGVLRRITEKAIELDLTQNTVSTEKFDLEYASTVAVQGSIDVEGTVKTIASGIAQTETVTCPDGSGVDPSEFLVINGIKTDGTSISYAASASISGSAQPTASQWLAIPVLQRASFSLTGSETDDEVAAAFVAAFNGITGFTANVTLTDNSDGTFTIINVTFGVGTPAADYFTAGQPSTAFTIVVNNAGTASAVNVANDLFTSVGHTFITGTKVALTKSGSFAPAPLTVTNYWVIKISADTFKLATSLANSLAGTAINITTQGSSGNTTTLTPEAISGASVKLQQSNSNPYNNAGQDVDMIWSDMVTAVTISADGTFILEKTSPPACRWGRVSAVASAGSALIICNLLIRGEQP